MDDFSCVGEVEEDEKSGAMGMDIESWVQSDFISSGHEPDPRPGCSFGQSSIKW